ncbi:DUF4286 family protein [Mycobacterium sp. E2497]|uniref:DUF4286 family protein n=1 Tax=Mycobacterium sp. E2497 TaxID=1834135 RepID=UPI0007FF8F2C|nr:DUF4286 family protein [Mycobacterium sp. E2497]OBI17580.1 hypothetical protein A5713_19920 [Mycobacterium sp. E2497]
MDKNVFLVFTNPIEGQDAAFNTWYDNVHVPEVLDIPGVLAARRYSLAEITMPDDAELPSLPAPAHRYLAVYELDREPNQVMTEFLKRVMAGELGLGDTLDLSTIGLTGWTARGDRIQAHG